MASLKRQAAAWWQAWQGVRDGRKLADRFPGLDSWNRLPQEFRLALEEAHRQYVSRVSTPEMAISWESCRLLCALGEIVKPARVLDLGSGFSSYVLRSWAKATGCETTIVSVDDNAFWLDRTKQFLESQGLLNGELHTWDNFALTNPRPFDLIFHDMGSIAFRAQTLPKVLAMRTPKGVVVLDDVHKRVYRPFAMSETRRAGLEYLSATRWTKDAFGRAAAIVVGPQA